MRGAATSSRTKGSAFARTSRVFRIQPLRWIVSPLHLVHLVTLLALLTASFTMTGGHAAMATPPAVTEHGEAAVMTGHCAEMLKDENGAGSKDRDGQSQASQNIDCMIACSGLPSAPANYDVQSVRGPERHFVPLASPLDGFHLKAETPPPRSFDA